MIVWRSPTIALIDFMATLASFYVRDTRAARQNRLGLGDAKRLSLDAC